MHLLGISGSLRAGSFNRKLMHEAARLFAPDTFTVGSLQMPIYDGDLEQGEGIPAAVQTLADQIAAADAVIISSPEYNKGPSGALKNALDWISRVEGNPWQDKPVAIMSAAAGRAGGERAQYILRWFMQPFQPSILQGPEVLIGGASTQFDENDQLTDERSLKLLQTLMDKLKAEAAG